MTIYKRQRLYTALYCHIDSFVSDLQTQLILNVSSSLLQSITCVCKYKQEDFLSKCIMIRKEPLAEPKKIAGVHL